MSKSMPVLKIAKYFDKDYPETDRRSLIEQIQLVKRIKRSESVKGRLPVKTEPFEHQVRGHAIGTTLDGTALLMEQRTGKTLTAIATVGTRHKVNHVERVVIVCPLTVADVWEEQFLEHAAFRYRLKVVSAKDVYKVPSIDYFFNVPDKLKILVINYEGFWRVKDELKKWKPQMVILDESQRIKKRGNKQSRAIHSFGKIAKYRLILTGTPITKNPIDAFSQYLFLNWAILGASITKFKDRYVLYGGYGGYEVVGYRHLKRLSRLIHSIAFRVRRKDVFDMPRETSQKLYVYLGKSRKLYDDLDKKMVAEFRGHKIKVPIALTKILRLQQITGGFLEVDGRVVQVGKEKLNALEEFMHDFPRDEKIVIVARFVPELEAISKLLTKLKVSNEILYGETPKTERKLLRKRFLKHRDPRALIVQESVGGVGLDFTSAWTMFFYSCGFNWGDHDQMKTRILGPNIKHPINYIHLLAKNTVDDGLIYPALKEKKNVAELVVDHYNPN